MPRLCAEAESRFIRTRTGSARISDDIGDNGTRNSRTSRLIHTTSMTQTLEKTYGANSMLIANRRAIVPAEIMIQKFDQICDALEREFACSRLTMKRVQDRIIISPQD